MCMCTYWNKVGLAKSKTKQNKKIDSIGIGLASPEEIRRWGERRLPNGTLIGKVDKDHTVDYESLKPIEGGLFCERIFGPVEDFCCSCERRGKKNEKFCPNCEVEFTKSRVRRTRMGYIPLAVPVAHVWYLRGRPSYIANLIGKSRNAVDRLAYGETFCESFSGNTHNPYLLSTSRRTMSTGGVLPAASPPPPSDADGGGGEAGTKHPYPEEVELAYPSAASFRTLPSVRKDAEGMQVEQQGIESKGLTVLPIIKDKYSAFDNLNSHIALKTHVSYASLLADPKGIQPPTQVFHLARSNTSTKLFLSIPLLRKPFAFISCFASPKDLLTFAFVRSTGIHPKGTIGRPAYLASKGQKYRPLPLSGLGLRSKLACIPEELASSIPITPKRRATTPSGLGMQRVHFSGGMQGYAKQNQAEEIQEHWIRKVRVRLQNLRSQLRITSNLKGIEDTFCIPKVATLRYFVMKFKSIHFIDQGLFKLFCVSSIFRKTPGTCNRLLTSGTLTRKQHIKPIFDLIGKSSTFADSFMFSTVGPSLKFILVEKVIRTKINSGTNRIDFSEDARRITGACLHTLPLTPKPLSKAWGELQPLRGKVCRGYRSIGSKPEGYASRAGFPFPKDDEAFTKMNSNPLAKRGVVASQRVCRASEGIRVTTSLFDYMQKVTKSKALMLSSGVRPLNSEGASEADKSPSEIHNGLLRAPSEIYTQNKSKKSEKYNKYHTLPLFSTFVYKEWSHRFSFLDYFIWSAQKDDLLLPFYEQYYEITRNRNYTIQQKLLTLVKNKFLLHFYKNRPNIDGNKKNFSMLVDNLKRNNIPSSNQLDPIFSASFYPKVYLGKDAQHSCYQYPALTLCIPYLLHFHTVGRIPELRHPTYSILPSVWKRSNPTKMNFGTNDAKHVRHSKEVTSHLQTLRLADKPFCLHTSASPKGTLPMPLYPSASQALCFAPEGASEAVGIALADLPRRGQGMQRGKVCRGSKLKLALSIHTKINWGFLTYLTCLDSRPEVVGSSYQRNLQQYPLAKRGSRRGRHRFETKLHKRDNAGKVYNGVTDLLPTNRKGKYCTSLFSIRNKARGDIGSHTKGGMQNISIRIVKPLQCAIEFHKGVTFCNRTELAPTIARVASQIPILYKHVLISFLTACISLPRRGRSAIPEGASEADKVEASLRTEVHFSGVGSKAALPSPSAEVQAAEGGSAIPLPCLIKSTWKSILLNKVMSQQAKVYAPFNTISPRYYSVHSVNSHLNHLNLLQGKKQYFQGDKNLEDGDASQLNFNSDSRFYPKGKSLYKDENQAFVPATNASHTNTTSANPSALIFPTTHLLRKPLPQRGERSRGVQGLGLLPAVCREEKSEVASGRIGADGYAISSGDMVMHPTEEIQPLLAYPNLEGVGQQSEGSKPYPEGVGVGMLADQQGLCEAWDSLKKENIFSSSEDLTIKLINTQQFPRLAELLSFTGGTALRELLSRFHLILLGKFLRYELKNLELKVNNLLALKTLTYSQGLLLGKLAKRRSKQIRRLKLLELFQSQKSNPEWMILSILPVLPPDLRPILRVNDDFVVASDLNRLYQTVLRRNNTIHERIDDPLPCPESGLFRQRSLQKAVDGLLENGKGGGAPLCASKRRPLISLSHVLKGKKGLFRQHLLGKRVDYSGRSVIVVGPRLNLHECGLPKEMAMELFQPFLLHRLKIKGFALSNTAARRLIQQENPVIWQILKQLVYEHPVLLNRAPTLHRLGIQAFQPRLVSGRAILLHPLVCSGFNADFDGDQMAVHVPLSFQARAEAWKIMWSKNNFLSPATGQPILVPSQDMVLGCYYLSVFVPRVLGFLTINKTKINSFESQKLIHSKTHTPLASLPVSAKPEVQSIPQRTSYLRLRNFTLGIPSYPRFAKGEAQLKSREEERKAAVARRRIESEVNGYSQHAITSSTRLLPKISFTKILHTSACISNPEGVVASPYPFGVGQQVTDARRDLQCRAFEGGKSFVTPKGISNMQKVNRLLFVDSLLGKTVYTNQGDNGDPLPQRGTALIPPYTEHPPIAYREFKGIFRLRSSAYPNPEGVGQQALYPEGASEVGGIKNKTVETLYLHKNKGHYFSNLQDSLIAYFQGRLQTHTPFWVRVNQLSVDSPNERRKTSLLDTNISKFCIPNLSFEKCHSLHVKKERAERLKIRSPKMVKVVRACCDLFDINPEGVEVQTNTPYTKLFPYQSKEAEQQELANPSGMQKDSLSTTSYLRLGHLKKEGSEAAVGRKPSRHLHTSAYPKGLLTLRACKAGRQATNALPLRGKDLQNRASSAYPYPEGVGQQAQRGELQPLRGKVCRGGKSEGGNERGVMGDKNGQRMFSTSADVAKKLIFLQPQYGSSQKVCTTLFQGYSHNIILEGNDTIEAPLELRLSADGNLVKVLTTFQNHYNYNATIIDQCQEKSEKFIKYMRTTAGRVVLNKAIFLL